MLNPTVEQANGQTVLRYTRGFTEEGDSVAVDVESGFIRFIYAFGEDNGLAQHSPTNRGSAEADLVAGGGSVSGAADTETKWKAHGIFMGLAWGFLVPVAIASSLLRHVLPLAPGVWYKLHFYCNSLASVFTLCGFAIAVSAINDEQGDSAEHFSRDTHHKVGLVVFLFTILQVSNGLVRPHAPAPPVTPPPEEHKALGAEENEVEEQAHDQHGGEGKSASRFQWEVLHRVLGSTILIMALTNCNSGIDFYEGRYNVDANLNAIFWTISMIVIGGALLVFVATAKRESVGWLNQRVGG